MKVVQDVVPDQYAKSEGVVRASDSATSINSASFIAPDASDGQRSFINARKVSRLLNRRSNDLSVSIQSDAPKHLAYISRSDTEFLYFTKAGRDVTLYILDRGFYARSIDLTANAVVKYYLHTINSDGFDTDPDGHGTCALSVAAGKQFGSVKQLKAVAVKLGVSGISEDGSGSRYIAISDFLDGLQSIEYYIYKDTNITTNNEIASFMKKLFYENFTKLFQNKIFYKEMKIYFSIKVLTKFVCHTKHYSIYSFTDLLIVSLRMKNSNFRYKRSNIKERL